MATLSVILTFTSVPSRVLIASVLPSTASIVPRIRVGAGACCAQADEARMEAAVNEATIRRGIHVVSFGIGNPSGTGALIRNRNPERGGLFLHRSCHCPSLVGHTKSHWRGEAIPADADAVALE